MDSKDKLKPGETLGLVMLSSDKTHLNNNAGDKKVHCVYLSCGNISKDVRSKASARCWVMVAQIPCVKFCEEKDFQGLLSDRLYHLCMDIVVASLKECAKHAVEMCDAEGFLRLVRAMLLAHVADYPEQQLVACTYGGGAPLAVAAEKDFGSLEEKPLRTGKLTLLRIRQLVTKPGTSIVNLGKYRRAAARVQLNGVYLPFWRDWENAEPSIFLTPEVLHGWHGFFYKHVMTWARTLMSDVEVDRRYSVLQPHTGYKHFPNGFTIYSQHTGREYRDLQRCFIGVIYGHATMTPDILKAFNALLEFNYIGQLETQTTDTLERLTKALRTFHAKKKALSATGVRDGVRRKGQFNIKKLENMCHVPRLGRLVGSIPQYSADATERCHITDAKVPYRATNRKEFSEQMCRFLDRREKVYLFSIHLAYRDSLERGEDSDRFIERFLPRLTKNEFENDNVNVPRNSTTAFMVTTRIPFGDMMLNNAATLFRLPKLCVALVDYFGVAPGLRSTSKTPPLLFTKLDCWDKLRLQLASDSAYDPVLPTHTINCPVPATAAFPSGLCNFVLVKNSPTSETVGIRGKSKETSSDVSQLTALHIQDISLLKFDWFSNRFMQGLNLRATYLHMLSL